MPYGRSLLSGILFISLLGPLPVTAGPIDTEGHPHPDKVQLVHEAEHDVDQAWEAYHRAALGGTVASPALQAEIEEHLHEARTLVSQALEAVERTDDGQVEHLVRQVRIHTTKALEGSKEHKK